MGTDLSDPAVFGRAYDEHSRSVYTAAYRILGNPVQAQDVVQDVFLRLWRRPRSFDASRGDLATYLRLMARSRALDLWRESQVRVRAADRLKIVHDSPSTEPADRDHDGDHVRSALSRLPETQREALVLAYWGGLTAAQIAQRANVPLGTAKSRLRLGLARLREEIPVAV